jgi:hypothetical protein
MRSKASRKRANTLLNRDPSSESLLNERCAYAQRAPAAREAGGFFYSQHQLPRTKFSETGLPVLLSVNLSFLGVIFSETQHLLLLLLDSPYI